MLHWIVASLFRRFQFTLPRGERPGGRARPVEGLGVSIHAPAGGATVGAGYQCAAVKVFQFTLPRGERQFPHSAPA